MSFTYYIHILNTIYTYCMFLHAPNMLSTCYLHIIYISYAFFHILYSKFSHIIYIVWNIVCNILLNTYFIHTLHTPYTQTRVCMIFIYTHTHVRIDICTIFHIMSKCFFLQGPSFQM